MLLKHLKEYYRDEISILTKEITQLEAWLGDDAGFTKKLGGIKRETQRWLTIYEK